MFGDFSRFENDPEVGLNGIYLSQGSPILDSDWNEQVAALTDWITVVGRLAAGETLRKMGFGVAPNGKSIVVNQGIALLSGRAIQNAREIEKEEDPRLMLQYSNPNDDNKVRTVYLLAVEQTQTANTHSKMRSRSGIRRGCSFSITDWRVLVSETALNGLDRSEQRFAGNNSEPFDVNPSRSFGDGRNGVPYLQISQDIDTRVKDRPQSSLDSATLCLIEYHGKIDQLDVFKFAPSPQNTVYPKEFTKAPVPGPPLKTVTISSDELPGFSESTTAVLLEYEDDDHVFEVAASLFQAINKKVESPLLSGKLTRMGTEVEITLSENSNWPDWKHNRNARLRVWCHRQDDSSMSFPMPGFRASYVLAPGVVPQQLLPGDRWYVPVENGGPAWGGSNRKCLSIPGHRQFRAIAQLGKVKINGKGEYSLAVVPGSMDTSELASANLSAPFGLVASVPQSAISTESVNHSDLEPVDYRLDESLHRLTGALNAARSLTRQTPCKELSTRVSYLPLRRWLASAYVHEIADLDLDGFLAKVRRSIDVAPEDEHRFREQAALILDEANQLAGSITPRPRSDTNRESDTMASAPSDNSHPMTLGSATRDALQQAFTQEIPRA